MGRYGEAIVIYEELIGRMDEEGDFTADNPYRIGLFSAFRLALIGYVQGDGAMIGQWVTWVNNTDSEHLVTEAANTLQASWSQGQDRNVACQQVGEQLSSYENWELFLPYEFGYGNPGFSVIDLCPDVE